MTVLGVLGVLIVLFGAGVLATKEGPVLVPARPDRADLDLPERALAAEDLRRVRFGLTVRGYRMAEVDLVLDRAASALADERGRAEQLRLELERLTHAQQAAEVRAARLAQQVAQGQSPPPTGPPREADPPTGPLGPLPED